MGEKNVKVLSRDGKLTGLTTGATRHCSMEGCTGLRLVVRWPDKKITHPCTKGMSFDGDHWQIL